MNKIHFILDFTIYLLWEIKFHIFATMLYIVSVMNKEIEFRFVRA